MIRKALITGITGQDGSYLAEHLLSKGYEVYGFIRRHSDTDQQLGMVSHLENEIKFIEGDITSPISVGSAIRICLPDEVYHLAAQSHVHVSFKHPDLTLNTNISGTLNILDSVRSLHPFAKIYNAATSEMFGNIQSSDPLSEYHPMNPVSPYGTSKLAAFNLCRNYRESYNMFISSGILFNHESPRRGVNFVTRKVCRAAARISMGEQDHLTLGNMDSTRDWGWAPDYVRAMQMMLDHDTPDDFVVATGRSHTISYLCKVAFSHLDLDYIDYIRTDSKFKRPNELYHLTGDSTKIKNVLGWSPTVTFEEMIRTMVDAELKLIEIGESSK